MAQVSQQRRNLIACGQPAAAVLLGLRRDPAPDRPVGGPRRHGAVPGAVRDDPRETAEGGLPAQAQRATGPAVVVLGPSAPGSLRARGARAATCRGGALAVTAEPASSQPPGAGRTSLGGAVPETLADGRPPADDSVLFSRPAVRGPAKCCRRGTDPRNPRRKPENAARLNGRRCNLGFGERSGQAVEADHGNFQRLIKPTLGFKSMKTACARIKGFEELRAVRKKRANAFQLQPGIRREVRLVERAFGVVPEMMSELTSPHGAELEQVSIQQGF